MRVPTPSRRRFLRTAAASLGTVAVAGGVGASVTGRTQDSGSISLSNGTYEIDVGAFLTTSELDLDDDWRYRGTSTLFLEYPAVQEAGGAVVIPNQLQEGYPEEGEPGRRYSARVATTQLSSRLSMERAVELSPDEASFEVSHTVSNAGSATLEGLRFYQYVDYDVGDPNDDDARYDESAAAVVQASEVDDGSVATGFAGTTGPDAWDVDDRNAVDQRLDGDGSLAGGSEYEGDAAAALRWDLGTLEPGASAAVDLTFAAGDGREAVRELLGVAASGDGEEETDDDGLPGLGIGAATAGLAGGYAYARLRGSE